MGLGSGGIGGLGGPSGMGTGAFGGGFGGNAPGIDLTTLLSQPFAPPLGLASIGIGAQGQVGPFGPPEPAGLGGLVNSLLSSVPAGSPVAPGVNPQDAKNLSIAGMLGLGAAAPGAGFGSGIGTPSPRGGIVDPSEPSGLPGIPSVPGIPGVPVAPAPPTQQPFQLQELPTPQAPFTLEALPTLAPPTTQLPTTSATPPPSANLGAPPDVTPEQTSLGAFISSLAAAPTSLTGAIDPNINVTPAAPDALSALGLGGTPPSLTGPGTPNAPVDPDATTPEDQSRLSRGFTTAIAPELSALIAGPAPGQTGFITGNVSPGPGGVPANLGAQSQTSPTPTQTGAPAGFLEGITPAPPQTPPAKTFDELSPTALETFKALSEDLTVDVNTITENFSVEQLQGLLAQPAELTEFEFGLIEAELNLKEFEDPTNPAFNAPVPSQKPAAPGQTALEQTEKQRKRQAIEMMRRLLGPVFKPGVEKPPPGLFAPPSVPVAPPGPPPVPPHPDEEQIAALAAALGRG